MLPHSLTPNSACKVNYTPPSNKGAFACVAAQTCVNPQSNQHDTQQARCPRPKKNAAHSLQMHTAKTQPLSCLPTQASTLEAISCRPKPGAVQQTHAHARHEDLTLPPSPPPRFINHVLLLTLMTDPAETTKNCIRMCSAKSMRVY